MSIMSMVWVGFGSLAVAFLLLLVLGLEVKINSIAKRIEGKLDKLGG